MALSPPTLPDAHRSASPGISLGDGRPQINPEAAAALESYNTRDTVKSALCGVFDCRSVSDIRYNFARFVCSYRALQGCRQCADHEAELLQDHGVKSIPNRYTFPAERTWLEGW